MAILICHGIIRASDAFRVAALDLPDHARQFDVVTAGDLAAIATCFPDHLPNGDTLEDHVAQAGGIAALALDHNRILTQFATEADVVPLRLESFHSEAASIAQMLTTDRARLDGLLDRIAGRFEFAARIDRLPVTAIAASEEPQSGRDYLQRRGYQRQQRDEARARQMSRVAEFTSAVAALGVASLSMPLPEPAVSPRCVARLALLVTRADFTAFERAAASLMARATTAGLDVTISGPWAPYYFVSSEGGDDGRLN
jgi:hypothetical protein